MSVTNTSSDAPVVIIGAGIGGLTAALGLIQAGIRVEIYEQASGVGDVGAGISLAPPASKGLYALGFKAALAREADPPKPSAALNHRTGEKLGGAFTERDYTAIDTSDTYLIHRADLFAILKAAVDERDPTALRFGRRFSGFVQDAAGVTARFEDGGEARGCVLLGCDGIRSKVRDQLFGSAPAIQKGQVAYRFLVPMDRVADDLGPGQANIFVAPQRSLLYYPIRHGTVLNCVALVCSEAWTGEGWSQFVEPAELQALFAGWHPTAVALAANAPTDKTAKWALFDRDPLPRWVEGRVALLGDSAHPMLPFLGMGAAMGIEDAVILGRAFAQAQTVEEALQLYQGARVSRAGEMLLDSRRQSDIFADGPGSGGTLRMSMAERMGYDPASSLL